MKAFGFQGKVLYSLLSFFLLALTSGGIYAQADIGCRPAQLVSVSVVHYAHYAKALVRFQTPRLSTRLILQAEDGSVLGEYHVPRSSGQLYLTNLPPNQIFTVYAEDYCGELRPLARFETFPGDDYGAGIQVSRELFGAIEKFTQQSEVGLVQFLAKENELPLTERLAFLQQYLLDGEPFVQDYGRQWPPEEVFAGAATDDCRCKFVFMRWQQVMPGSMLEGIIYPSLWTNSGSLGDPDALYEFVGQWAGPAKDLSLYTRGCRTGNAPWEYEFDETNEEQAISPNHAELGYAYVCTNYEQLPRGCECEDKCIYLSSDYISSLYTHITKDPGWCVTIGNKAAWADAEDFAVLLKEEADSLEVLAAGQAHVSAYAAVDANLEFWLAPLDVAQSVLSDFSELVSGDSINLGFLLENLVEGIKNVLSVKAWEHTGTWGIKEKRTALIAVNDRRFCIPPNHPVRFHLYSAAYLRSGGKRKWRAWAAVRSAFQINAVVHADAGPPQACCTDQLGNWIAKGMDELYDSDYMLGNVVADFALWPWDGWDPTQPLPGEYGELSYSIGCEPGLQGPPIGWLRTSSEHEGDEAAMPALSDQAGVERTDATSTAPAAAAASEERDPASAELSWPCRLYVYDLSGRLVWTGVEAWPRSLPAIVEALRADGWIDGGKVYIFHWRSYRAAKTEKVFVH